MAKGSIISGFIKYCIRFVKLLKKGKIILSASLGSVLFTTSLIAGAAVFTFNFGDKTHHLTKYTGEVSKLVSQGRTEEACAYMDQFISALDEYLTNPEKDSKAQATTQYAKSSGNDKKSDQKIFHQSQKYQEGRLCRHALELLRANIFFKSNKITNQEWLSVYKKTLNDNAKESGYVMSTLCALGGTNLDLDLMQTIAMEDIPFAARDEIELYLFSEEYPRNKTPDQIWSELFDQLFQQNKKPEDQAKLLRQYVRILDRRNQRDEVKDALENLVRLFPDNALGVQAFKLRVGRMSSEIKRNKFIVETIEKHPNAAIARAFKHTYCLALIKQGQFRKALDVIDADRIFVKNDPSEKKAELLLGLTEKICQIVPEPIVDRTGKLINNEHKLDFLVVCEGVREELLKAGDVKGAISFLFSVLRKQNALPVNLATGKTVTDVSEIGNIGNPNHANHVSQYLLAQVLYANGAFNAVEQISSKMLKEKLPGNIHAYISFLMARRCTIMNDYRLAIKYAEDAKVFFPESPVLSTFITLNEDLWKAQQQPKTLAEVKGEK